MWVLFAPDPATIPLWQTLEENEFFELQGYKPATSNKSDSTSLLSMLTALPSTLLAPSSSRAPASLVGSGTDESFPYRIIIKSQPPYGQRYGARQGKESSSSEVMLPVMEGSGRSPAQVIAIAKDLRIIKEHWNWLVNDMSTACSFFTRESEKEENELWDFLLMKFTSMAQQEAKKREIQREREREKAMERERQIEIASFVDNKAKYMKKQANIIINEEEEDDIKAKEKRFEEMDQSRQALWKKLFPKISTIERLIVEYSCSLERKGVERRGLLLVTPRHVCFHSPRLNTRVAIYWRVITSLSRATAANGTVPAIYVTCLGAYHEEFLFHSLADFEQTMSLLVKVWHLALMEVPRSLLTLLDRDGDEDAKNRLMSVTREQILCEIERDKHRKIFRMPKDEVLIAEFCCSLWMENVIQVYEGCLYISANFVCFHAEVEGHNFSVTIPFREVLDIISVDSKLIQVNTHSNKFSFSLLWRRQHCCELMVQLWSRRIRSSDRLLEKVPPAEGPWEEFGFVGLGPIVKDTKHFRADYSIKQKLQRKRWEEYISKYGWGIQMIKTSDVLRDIVRYGIPDELKGGLWQIFLGSAHSLCVKVGEYQNMLKQYDGKNSDAISEIERDVNRSFPEHPYFQSEKGKQALRNVLIAYSWRNPSLGYCQSMNIICSLLLLFMREEEAFWTLTVLCEELFPQYFTPDMLGSMTDQHVLEDLVAEHFPKLNAHLESIQLPLVLISFPWFMCLFIGYIPMQTSIRILDILFCEGYDSTFIFKVALAVFKYNERFILNTRDFSKLVIQLKFTNLDCDTLLEITEDFWWVTSKLINEMRDYHRFQLLKESKSATPQVASPAGTPVSARSTSAPTHFPRAPSTPVQTPTPTPSSSPPQPSYLNMPIRTRSDSSLFAAGVKSPLGPMSVPEGAGSLTTIPFLTTPEFTGSGNPPASAPSSYLGGKTPSPSATPRKVQFDGTAIPVAAGSDKTIMSALTRLSSKERLDLASENDSDSSTDTEDDSSLDESSEDGSETTSEISESEKSDTGASPVGVKTEERSDGSRGSRRKRSQDGSELFDMELEKPQNVENTDNEPNDTRVAPVETPVVTGEGGSKSEPATPLRTTRSDDLFDAEEIEKEKRRKRKMRSRRRRLASLGRPRTRKSKERIDKGKDKLDEEEEDEEQKSRFAPLDLDLNLAWRMEDRGDGNKGVKYLQRFLFKKRRRHSDGYLDIIKEGEELSSPRVKAGDEGNEPAVTHRRFFVEEDEGEEREQQPSDFSEAPDSARRERNREKRRSDPECLTPRNFAQDKPEVSPRTTTSAPPSSSVAAVPERPSERDLLITSGSAFLRTRDQHQANQNGERSENSGEGREKEKEEKDAESASESSSSESETEGEREDELKSSIFISSTSSSLPRVRKMKKVRERRASVANLLKKEPSELLLDRAGAFIERKRAEQAEEEAGGTKRTNETSASVHDNAPAAEGRNKSPSSDRMGRFSKDYTTDNTSSVVMLGSLTSAPVKATFTPGGRSPPLMLPHKTIEELREPSSSADEESSSDVELMGTSPDAARRKKIRSKLRSRRLSLSEPNLASPKQRGGNGNQERQEEEEWERTSDGEGQATNGRYRDGSRRGDTSSSDDESPRENGMEGSEVDSYDGEHRRSEDGGEGGDRGSRRRAKFFKYPVDILSKASVREYYRERRDKERTKDEDKEKKKKERLDEKEARRRDKEERRKVASNEKDKEKENRELLGDSEKKRRHKEEKELRRRKEEEDRESKRKKEEEEKELRRKKKEEHKEKKKLHKLEKEHERAERKHKDRELSHSEEGPDKECRDKHKKAFGLLPLPHLHHGHSLSFHLPSSPRRGTTPSSPRRNPPSPRGGGAQSVSPEESPRRSGSGRRGTTDAVSMPRSISLDPHDVAHDNHQSG